LTTLTVINGHLVLVVVPRTRTVGFRLRYSKFVSCWSITVEHFTVWHEIVYCNCCIVL